MLDFCFEALLASFAGFGFLLPKSSTTHLVYPTTSDVGITKDDRT